MKVLRIILTQNTANYKKEETIDNKMSYPLPTPSMIIGMLHDACGYKIYHPMNISIQGRYESINSRVKKGKCFHNSRQDDRGTLVKMVNATTLSEAYTKVAKSLERGSSFKENKNIQIQDEILYNEYINLINEKKYLSSLKKTSNKEEAKEIAQKIKFLRSELDSYRTFDVTVTKMDILNNVKLVLHIQAEEEVLNDILNNEANIKTIGRSDDLVQIEDISFVDLKNIEKETKSNYHAYLNCNNIESFTDFDKNELRGTCYYLNKDYEIIENQRIFKKIKALYTSEYMIDRSSKNIYHDNDDFIVNFL